MTRFLSWSGWLVVGCALLAAGIVIHALVREPHRERPGMAVQDLPTGATLVGIDTPGGPRLIVTSLQTGGPGSRAGLKVGDEIEDVDGLPAPTLAAFDKDVASGSYDDVDVRIRRGDRLLDIHLRRRTGGAA